MRRTHLTVMSLLIVAATAFPHRARAQDEQPDLTGTWLFNVVTDAGGGTPTVVLAQKADSLSGTYTSEIFGEQQIRGRVTDGGLIFSFTADLGGASLTVTYSGTIASADSLRGTVQLGDAASGTFTAKRQPAGEPGQERGGDPLRATPSSSYSRSIVSRPSAPAGRDACVHAAVRKTGQAGCPDPAPRPRRSHRSLRTAFR